MTVQRPAAVARAPASPTLFVRKYGAAYLFLVPAAVLYAVFGLYPFVGSIYFSLTSWDGAQPVQPFVGLANYLRLVQDPLVWLSLGHNLIWVVVGTVVPIAMGLLLAVLLASRPRGMAVFRTIYFMPVVLSPVIVAVIWGWIYHPIFGILNRLLQAVGLGSLARGWLGDVNLALYAVLLAAIWGYFGFVFVIFLAGLQNIDIELIYAARIDGANAWQSFWNVTLPQLSHVVTMVTTLSLIGGFNVFDIVFVLTQGGPANSTELIATYIYRVAFAQNEVGYGAALSMVMTIIALAAALIFIAVRERGAEE